MTTFIYSGTWLITIPLIASQLRVCFRFGCNSRFEKGRWLWPALGSGTACTGQERFEESSTSRQRVVNESSKTRPPGALWVKSL
jgi:hypothetical protein